jgi:hypothetical protein
MPTFGLASKVGFRIYRHMDLKPDNFQTLPAKLKHLSIAQDFGNIFFSWWCILSIVMQKA